MTRKECKGSEQEEESFREPVPSEGCWNCKFSIHPYPVTIDGSEKVVLCRRYPPVPTDAINANIPRVNESGWCGEWKKMA